MRRVVAFSRSPRTARRGDGAHFAGPAGNLVVVIPGRDIAEILIKHGYSTVDRVSALFIDEFKP